MAAGNLDLGAAMKRIASAVQTTLTGWLATARSALQKRPPPPAPKRTARPPPGALPDLSGSGESSVSSVSSASHSSGTRRRVPRPGGSFTPARDSAPKHSITGGSKKLSEDELQALQHDTTRRREEAKARALIDSVRGKYGKFKLEKLASLPRTLSPEGVTALQQAHPSLTAAALQLITPLVAAVPRDVCDRAAVFQRWSEADRQTFYGALPPGVRETYKGAAEAFDGLEVAVRQALLRAPRAPVLAQVDALAAKWTSFRKEEVREVARALAFFDGDALTKVTAGPETPVKVAPQGIRG